MSFVNLEIKNVEKTWRDKQLQISSHVIRSQRRSHLEGQGDHAPPHPNRPLPHFTFLTKQGPTVSVSLIRDIALYGD